MCVRDSFYFLIALFISVAGLLTAGCGGKDSPTKPVTPPPPPPPPPPSVASIVVNPTTASLVVGGTQRFTASARASNGSTISGVNITWTSSNVAVVTINASGLATAVGAGMATIQAAADGITSMLVSINVTLASVVTVTVEPSSDQELTVGDTIRFTATALTADGSRRDDVEVAWTSSNLDVATINASGVATAVGAGMATIQAAADGITSMLVSINVTLASVVTVTVEPSSDQELTVGDTIRFTATALTADGSRRDDVEVAWTSSNLDVATINASGVATAVSAGMATIQAAADGITSMLVTINVTLASVVTVTVEPSSDQELTVGDTIRFTATALTADGSRRDDVEVAWTSSNLDVATINASGVATAVSAGMATIQAAADGITSILVTINVTLASVVTVTVEPSSDQELTVGDTIRFTATALTADGSRRDDVEVAWTSSNLDVATINASGVATAVSAGMATIQAAADGITSMLVTINVTLASVVTVTVEPSSDQELTVGDTIRFTATALTADGSRRDDVEVAWTSSNLDVATINASGVATAVSAGMATIQAAADGITSILVTINVTLASVVTVTVEPSSDQELTVGDTIRFTATALTADGSRRDDVEVAWTSSNLDVATVNTSGIVMGVGAGTTEITAVADGVASSSVTVSVIESPPPSPMVSSIVVSPLMVSIDVGRTQQFEATAMTEDGMVISDIVFSWTSSDEGVATVDPSGLATGINTGEATITAMVDSKSGTATLTVTEPLTPPVVSSIVVIPSMVSINVGQTQQFSATAMTAEGMLIPGVEFMWTSSDEMVATVTLSGLATGVDAGEVIITATVDSVSGSSTLTVTEPPPVVATVTVSPSEASIEEGQSLQFSAVAMTAEGMTVPDVEFVWTSSRLSVATVSTTGLARGVGAGTVTITATADSVSDTSTLVVTEPPPVVATVTVSPSEASIEEGQSLQFSAVAMTAEGMTVPDVEFVWTSSDEMVATVSTTGLARGVGAGTVTITATADSVSDTSTLVVTEPPPVVATVTVSPSEASIEEGQSLQFSAVAMTAEGMTVPDVEFVWTSSDEMVATVSTTGLARGVGAGTVTITATADSVSDTSTLVVTEPPPVVATVTVSPSEASIEEGQSLQFSAVAMTAEGMLIPGVEFMWTSSGEMVATVTLSGLATGVDAGEVIITATVDSVSGSSTLTVTEPPPVVATVTVSPSEASIEEGQSLQFSAVAMTAEGMTVPDVEFVWTSSRLSVATVSTTGLARGVGAGTVTITATADSVSDTSTLVVTEPPPVVATVTVSPSEASIEEGQSLQFSAVAMTAEGMLIPGVEFMWTSSDEMVATVTLSGLATGVDAGEVIITATVDSVSGSSTLTVTEPPPVVATVTVSPSEASIEEGQSLQFSAVAMTAEGMLIPGVEFVWTSSDEMVATVTLSGLARGVGAGTVSITATADSVSDTSTLVVTEPPPVVATVTVSPSEASIEERQSLQFSAVAMTAEGMTVPGVEFVWTSSRLSVATVSTTGLATAVSAGSTQIMATAEGKSGSVTLMVTEPPNRRSGMFSGANGYRTSGTVTLEQDSTGKLVLRFESDFKVSRAPDIWVVLYSSANINYSRRRPPPAGTYENLGRVKANSGTQTYDVPSHVQLDTYDFVIIHCIAFNSEVGIAELQP